MIFFHGLGVPVVLWRSLFGISYFLLSGVQESQAGRGSMRSLIPLWRVLKCNAGF